VWDLSGETVASGGRLSLLVACTLAASAPPQASFRARVSVLSPVTNVPVELATGTFLVPSSPEEDARALRVRDRTS